MLRIVAVVLLPGVASIACSTAPSTANSDDPDNRQLMGVLLVHDRFTMIGSPDASPAESTLWPGRFAATLDMLRDDLLVIDVDAPGVGDLTVRLADDAGEFPVGTGGFSFTASQHDLPYAIRGEHEVCYIDEPYDPQDSCTTASNGELNCGSSAGYPLRSRLTERTRIVTREVLDVSFVEAQSAQVVAQFSAFNGMEFDERFRHLVVCD